MNNHLIAPYGSPQIKINLLYGKERLEMQHYAKNLPQIAITTREFCDLIMIGNGSFSPLTGYMNYEDWLGVCNEMKTSQGLFWPIPITLSISAEDKKSLAVGMDVSLTYGNETEKQAIVAVLKIEELYPIDKQFQCMQVFGANDPAHPGVLSVLQQGEFNLAGTVRVLSEGDFAERFRGLYLTPQETRDIFSQRGWQTVVAFQTRNPMHLSHEHLVVNALKEFDGVFIHSLLGDLKEGDIPPEVSVKAIKELINHYLPAGRLLQGGYPLSMRYAGPKEALLHAIFRQNYGCSYIIIGRDHAGMGQFYAPFAAQEIFSQIPPHALAIQPLKMDFAFWCYRCKQMVFAHQCSHSGEDHLLISGTALRKMLAANESVPEHFSRPEVLAILKEYYLNERNGHHKPPQHNQHG